MFILTVVCHEAVFDAYWYGYGHVVSSDVTDDREFPRRTYVVNYGTDEYRAQYQAGRFASGLYFAKVEEVCS